MIGLPGLVSQGACGVWPIMGMGGMMGYWWIVPIIFIGMFFFFYPKRRISFQRDYPENIARRRYARGEISKEEYDDIIKTLK